MPQSERRIPDNALELLAGRKELLGADEIERGSLQRTRSASRAPGDPPNGSSGLHESSRGDYRLEHDRNPIVRFS